MTQPSHKDLRERVARECCRIYYEARGSYRPGIFEEIDEDVRQAFRMDAEAILSALQPQGGAGALVSPLREALERLEQKFRSLCDRHCDLTVGDHHPECAEGFADIACLRAALDGEGSGSGRPSPGAFAPTEPGAGSAAEVGELHKVVPVELLLRVVAALHNQSCPLPKQDFHQCRICTVRLDIQELLKGKP